MLVARKFLTAKRHSLYVKESEILVKSESEILNRSESGDGVSEILERSELESDILPPTPQPWL